MKKVAINNKLLLAYVVGISLGDGNLSNPNGRAVRLRVSCDTKYPRLIKKIFGAIQNLLPDNKVNMHKRKVNCVDISCYSNLWPELLGWDVGDKIRQKCKIPKWILNNKKYSISCLRGLFETDGSIYLDRGYWSVMFVSANSVLAHQVYFLIQKFQYTPHLYTVLAKTGKKHFHVRLTKNTLNFIKILKAEKK